MSRKNHIGGRNFRIWATQRMRELIIKGFTLDDERLKRGGGGNYKAKEMNRDLLAALPGATIAFA